MVSADNLHFDVLGLIFAHLSGNDLLSVALVSKSFLNGVTPRLYQTLVFTHSQAKRYPKIISPFTSLLAKPFLAVHVRICDITALPLYKGQPNQEFLADCVRALDLCPNLTRFRLAPNVLPSFLMTLSRKEKLKDLYVNASVTTDQAEILISLKGLRNIRIDHGSWRLMNVFPRWISVLSPTLTHLTFSMTSDLNEVSLERALVRLPGLLGLHIRNCMNVEHAVVFRLASNTPLLESLSVTTWENPTTSCASFGELNNLRHLHLDTRNTLMPATVPTLWSNIIAHTKSSHAPLASLTLQLSDTLTLTNIVIEDILEAHAGTLTSLRFIKCDMNIASLKQICRRCKNLERLAMHVPVKDMMSLSHALGNSESLQTLVDEPDPHMLHGPRATLKHEDVKMLMLSSPNLRTIVSDSRSWKGSGDGVDFRITLERLKSSPLSNMMSF